MADNEQRPLPPLISSIRQHRFAVLLAVLLLLFCYGVFVDLFATGRQPVVARVTIGTLITAMLFSAVVSVSKSRRTLRNAMILGVPAIVAELLDVSAPEWPLGHLQLGHLLSALFLGYVIVVLLKFIFASKHVTANTIFASLCIYLLLGTLWAMAYSVLATMQREPFWYSLALEEISNTEDAMRIGAEPAGLEFYFSFVTMTTLGYGDIVPRSAAARGLATLQAVVGQLYLAVLVARLVGLHVAHSSSRKE